MGEDLRESARKTGADVLSQGSPRSEGARVRVSVRLIDGTTGLAIWSGAFAEKRTGLFELEDQIARAVSSRLELHLAARRDGIDVLSAPQRAQAYEYIQQARTLSAKDFATPPDKIRRLYELAVAADPRYAPAHSGMAGALIVSQQPDKGRALEEIQRALELDPDLPGARVAQILYYRDADPNLATARALCAGALEQLPNAGTILRMCATVEGLLMNQGKVIELTRRAAALDPLSAAAHGGMMLALYQGGGWRRRCGRPMCRCN